MAPLKVVTLQPEWDGNTWREIGKTEKGVVVVTSHLYEGIKSWPLDIELYQKAVLPYLVC